MNQAEGGHQAWGLSEYLGALLRRKWIVLEALIVVPAIAIGVALNQDAVYRASADVLLNRANVGAAVLGIPDPTGYQDPLRFSETQAALAQTPEVAQRAADLADVPGVTAGDILSSGVVRPSLDSDLLRFSVSSKDPELAPTLATAYARGFIDYRSELDTAALQEARRDLGQRLQELRAAGATGTALYANLADKEQQLRTLELLQSRHRLIRPALGSGKISPQPMKNATLGIAGGILLALGLVFLLEMLDKRVRSEHEIERRLQLPLLARVPEGPGSDDRKLVMLVEPRSIHAEPYRRLRINLEFANAETRARTILVTSAVAREGKSTTVGNLAIAAARAGRHVALVDFDLRLPTLHERFGVPQGPGATDVALGTVALDEALQRIRLPQPSRSAASTNGASGRLEFLPVGTLPPNPGEFLGTTGVADILAALCDLSDLVLIDAPPLLSVGDTLPLGARVDAIVVVTRFGLVSQPMLADLARALQALPPTKLGFVITGATPEETYVYGDAYSYSDRDGRVVDLSRPEERPESPPVAPARWAGR